MNAAAQLRDQGLSMGVGAGAAHGITDVTSNKAQVLARAASCGIPSPPASRGNLDSASAISVEMTTETQIIPIEYRFVVSPFKSATVNPYLYVGAGALHYTVEMKPPVPTSEKFSGWSAVVPAGIGVQTQDRRRPAFELSGGYTYVFSKNLNAILETKEDAYQQLLAGLTLVTARARMPILTATV